MNVILTAQSTYLSSMLHNMDKTKRRFHRLVEEYKYCWRVLRLMFSAKRMKQKIFNAKYVQFQHSTCPKLLVVKPDVWKDHVVQHNGHTMKRGPYRILMIEFWTAVYPELDRILKDGLVKEHAEIIHFWPVKRNHLTQTEESFALLGDILIWYGRYCLSI